LLDQALDTCRHIVLHRQAPLAKAGHFEDLAEPDEPQICG